MAHLFVALFFILYGLTVLFGLALPLWIQGVLALAAGILLLAERFGLSVRPKT